MSEPSEDPRSISATGEERMGMPRWVMVLLIVVGAIVLLLVVTQLTGIGGGHGPARHGAAPARLDAVGA